ncbi:MAG: radical SAM protein [Stygiobacter sp.]|nr:MAG: radical SAM protein [Stygiobacter sp.]
MIYQSIRNSIAGWYFTEEEIQQAVSGKRMLNPSIDLTNACNLNCPYCYIEEKNSERKVRKPNELTLVETLRIIDDLKNCGAKTINIVGAGEPTIDPHFEEIINYIHSKGLTTVLFTNGIRFVYYQKLLRLLYDRNVSIVLKYNFTDAKNQDLVAGRNGYTLKRNSVLRTILDYGFNSHMPTRFGLDIIVFSGNAEEVLKIHQWCRKENIFPIAGEYIPTGRTENGEFHGHKSLETFGKKEKFALSKLLQPIGVNERRKLYNRIKDYDKKIGIEHNDCAAYYGGGICTQILGLYIDIEGNIWPCVARKKMKNNLMQEGLLGNFRNGVKPSIIWNENCLLDKVGVVYNGGCPFKKLITSL